MLLFLLDALKDSNDAIKLDVTNIKAYIRKGVSLYNQDLKEEALQVFVRGLEFDCKLILFILFYKNIFFILLFLY